MRIAVIFLYKRTQVDKHVPSVHSFSRTHRSNKCRKCMHSSLNSLIIKPGNIAHQTSCQTLPYITNMYTGTYCVQNNLSPTSSSNAISPFSFLHSAIGSMYSFTNVGAFQLYIFLLLTSTHTDTHQVLHTRARTFEN